MERASSKHSPRVDDETASEVRGIVQGTSGGRVEEWKMPELQRLAALPAGTKFRNAAEVWAAVSQAG